MLDLLNPSPRCLNVRWAKDRGFYAENLFKVECEDIGDLEGVLEEGKWYFALVSRFTARCRCILVWFVERKSGLGRRTFWSRSWR